MQVAWVQVGPFGAQNPPPDPPQSRGIGTPRGLGSSEREKLKPVMDSLHGRALGAAALLVASMRYDGVPDFCFSQGFMKSLAACGDTLPYSALNRSFLGCDTKSMLS